MLNLQGSSLVQEYLFMQEYLFNVLTGASNVYCGVITYGGLDRHHCGDVIEYQSLLLAAYWQFKVKKFMKIIVVIKKFWKMLAIEML